jgi:HlyD family secretion protein
VYFYAHADAHSAVTYRTAAVATGNIKSTVSATGSLGAVRTVQVGTQVSGQVSAIYVDFNDHVKKGQLIARIDPTLQQQAVEDAQIGVERARAALNAAQADFQREKQMHDARIVTDVEFSSSQVTYEQDQASLKSAQIALDKARQNLAYTNIYAPIDGVIVERDVDVGQTVAASLSAPQLFIIANDLSQMQILASVDESDIGQIKDGQPVSFTVQSYPNQPFTGTVSQVRLQSKTTDNVVNYTAVVDVPNTTGKLLPGMTATVQFQTASVENVLEVPSAALRFRPAATAKLAASAQDSASRSAAKAGAQAGAQARTAGGAAAQGSNSGAARQWSGTRTPGASGARSTIGTLWVQDSTGALSPVRVRTGLTDGQNTQVSGKSIKAGMQVILGEATPGATASAAPAATTNPFQQQRGGARGGAPRGM